MCDVFESHESYYVSELIRQLGALYDKEKEKGAGNGGIQRERQRVSVRLIQIAARVEFKQLSPHALFFSPTRES